jgi:hypothetical protein
MMQVWTTVCGHTCSTTSGRPLSPSQTRKNTSRTPVGAENSVTSCELHVLVYEAAESVSSQWPNGRFRGWGPLPPARNAADTAMTDTAMTNEFGKDWTKVNGTGPGVLPTAYCWPCEPNSLIACRSTASNSPRASQPKINRVRLSHLGRGSTAGRAAAVRPVRAR